MFQNLYAKVDGKERDILDNGSLSCAIFVSIILQSFELIKKPHATVIELLKDMEVSGWKKSHSLKVGDVIVWEPLDFTGDGVKHLHVGFYLGKDKAVSNDWKVGTPAKHHFTFGTRASKPKRRIVAMYRHKLLQ